MADQTTYEVTLNDAAYRFVVDIERIRRWLYTWHNKITPAQAEVFEDVLACIDQEVAEFFIRGHKKVPIEEGQISGILAYETARAAGIKVLSDFERENKTVICMDGEYRLIMYTLSNRYTLFTATLEFGILREGEL